MKPSASNDTFPNRFQKNNTAGIWFNEVAEFDFAEADLKLLVKRCTDAYLGFKEVNTKGLSPALLADKKPRMVFVTLTDTFGPAYVYLGTGKGIVAAVKSVVNQILPISTIMTVAKIDFVESPIDITQSGLQRKHVSKIDFYGLAFAKQTGFALLADEISSKSKRQRHHDLIASYKKAVIEKSKVYLFSSKSFYADQNEVVKLYRGHRFYKKLNEKKLLKAASLGAKYLTRSVKKSGKFIYSYLTRSDKVQKKYNMLRHAGTIYAMLEYYEVSKDKEVLAAAETAIGYLKKKIKPCGNKKQYKCVVDKEYVKLGGNGLAIIALSKYTLVTSDKQYIPLMQSLASWMLSVQKPNGQFVYKIRLSDEKDTGFVSEYYPGEAMLALVRLYNLDKNEKWLDAAEKDASYLIHIRDKGKKISRLNHDHWLLMALNELYRHRKKKDYLEHTVRIVTAITDAQHLEPLFPDYHGSYYVPPRTTPTAVRSEGLIAAYHLLLDHKYQTAMLLKIKRAFEAGISFQLQTQFRKENTLYLKNAQRVMGGFKRGLGNYEIRIDYVQHNVSSILGMYKMLRDGEIEY
jgi:hypothetical protein